MVEAIFLDDYERNERDKRVAPNPQAVEAVIREIAPRSSADVFLLSDSDDVGQASRWLAVTASLGRYAVCAQLAENGPWVNLLGDADADGETEFAHGGQGGTWPKRFLVEADDAVAVACHYLVTGDLLDPSRWWADEH
jgi:immunity protein Imm1 of predicted polymorphic toxin system